MRKIIVGLASFSLMLSLLSACGGNVKKQQSDAQVLMQDTMTAQGVQKMQPYAAEMDVVYKGKTYHTVIKRESDESLPHVMSEMGDEYLDNSILLNITCGGKTVLNRFFTKKDFEPYVDTHSMAVEKTILEGLVFDKVTSSGIIFAASVSYPQTDLYCPLSLTVTADGGLSIRSVEVLDDTLTEDSL